MNDSHWARAMNSTWLDRRAGALLLALAMAWAAGCHGRPPATRVYQDASVHLTFAYPGDWQELPLPNNVVTANLAAPDGNMRLAYAGAVVYDILFGDLQHNLEFFAQIVHNVDADYVILTNQPIEIAACPALQFEAAVGQEIVRGFVIFNQYEVYFFTFHANWQDPRSVQVMDQIRQSVAVAPQPRLSVQDIQDYYKITTLPATNELDDALAYGKTLLQTRDVSIANYNNSAQTFRGILLALYDQHPHPALYREAMPWLDLANTFTFDAYQICRFKLERNLGLQRQQEAVAAAQDILKLYPRPSPPNRYAQAALAQAYQLPFND